MQSVLRREAGHRPARCSKTPREIVRDACVQHPRVAWPTRTPSRSHTSRLTSWTPVGGAVLLALALRLDRGAAAEAGAVGSAVDPDGAGAGFAGIAGGDAPWAAGGDVGLEQELGRGQDAAQGVIGQGRDVG